MTAPDTAMKAIHMQGLADAAKAMKAREALAATLDKLHAVPVTMEGVEVVCYIDADDNCEYVMLGDTNIAPLLELMSCAGKSWQRVIDDHVDTGLEQQRREEESSRVFHLLADREAA